MSGGTGMDIGAAIHALRNGHRVTRPAWAHGPTPGVPWLVLVPGSQITVEAGRPLGDGAPELVGRTVEYQPHVDLVDTDRRVRPWTPTHADLLADDWQTVD